MYDMADEGQFDPAVVAQIRSHSYKSIAWGIGLIAVGIVLTLGSVYNAEAGENGGVYYLVWGPVVFGLWRIGKAGWGLWQLNHDVVASVWAPPATPETEVRHPQDQPPPRPQPSSAPAAWPQRQSALTPSRSRRGSVI